MTTHRTPTIGEMTAAVVPPGADPNDETQLLDRLRAGEEAAFEDMVRLYGGRLLAVARRLLRNDDDAQDAVQDGFLAAFRALRTFRGECRLSTWLHRIVVNAALMKLRTRRRHPEEPITELLPTFRSDGRHAIRFQMWSDVEKTLADREVLVVVRAAIDRLPESYRTVLVLRDIEEMDTETVAQMFGVTSNAVKIRLHRARQALVTLLRPQLGIDGPDGAAQRSSCSRP